jgi:hypothetical protein
MKNKIFFKGFVVGMFIGDIMGILILKLVQKGII